VTCHGARRLSGCSLARVREGTSHFEPLATPSWRATRRSLVENHRADSLLRLGGRRADLLEVSLFAAHGQLVQVEALDPSDCISPSLAQRTEAGSTARVFSRAFSTTAAAVSLADAPFCPVTRFPSSSRWTLCFSTCV
jgi:hypothetical protein